MGMLDMSEVICAIERLISGQWGQLLKREF
jgi:hypothetical protein